MIEASACNSVEALIFITISLASTKWFTRWCEKR
nr:MAG TPA: hypothetical protein [Caudoviricetes sp.]